MKHSITSLFCASVLLALSSCSSTPKVGHTPMTLAAVDTAWGLVGDKDLDEMGIGLAIACKGNKDQMVGWFAKNNGCVQYGQYKNEVRYAMEGVENPTAEQIADAEASAIGMMSPDDQAALSAHLETQGDAAIGVIESFGGTILFAQKVQDVAKGAKDKLSGNVLEKVEAGAKFLVAIDQAAALITFLDDSHAVISQWTTKYEEWGNTINEI